MAIGKALRYLTGWGSLVDAAQLLGRGLHRAANAKAPGRLARRLGERAHGLADRAVHKGQIALKRRGGLTGVGERVRKHLAEVHSPTKSKGYTATRKMGGTVGLAAKGERGRRANEATAAQAGGAKRGSLAALGESRQRALAAWSARQGTLNKKPQLVARSKGLGARGHAKHVGDAKAVSGWARWRAKKGK